MAKVQDGGAGTGRGLWQARRRGGRVPLYAGGLTLVLVSIVAVAYLVSTAGRRVEVLEVARPVPAGQALTASDLRRTAVAADAQLGLVAADEARSVVGQAASVPLVPGTLLHRGLLGAAQYPPSGRVLGSVALKPGRYPQGLAAGASVRVFIAPPKGQPAREDETPQARQMSATVVGVDPAGDGQGAAVVNLELGSGDARVLAAADPDVVSIVQTAPGDR